jgi:Fe-S cluster biogenesis protein NfuA
MNWMNKLFAGNEPAAPTGDPERIAQVESVLVRLRPHFEADGGDIRLVRVDEFGWVELSMHGACNGCSASTMTLKGAIEPELRAAFDWVEGVRTL